MNLFGFMFFASLIIAPIPSYIINVITKKTNSVIKGKTGGLGFLFACTSSIMICIRKILLKLFDIYII